MHLVFAKHAKDRHAMEKISEFTNFGLQVNEKGENSFPKFSSRSVLVKGKVVDGLYFISAM
jgi:hypothetical protein